MLVSPRYRKRVSDGPIRVTQPLLDVVEALLEADDNELHGWAIMKTTSRSGPTVYKILERLSGMNWVTARWEERPEEPNKPRRRFYRLTGEGARQARVLVARRRPQPSRQWLPAFGCEAQ